jgi:hypothetical protein
MSAPAVSLEVALCAAYRGQAEHYRAAAAVAETLAGSLRDGREIAEPLGRVMGLISAIAAGEERVRAARERWVRSGGKPGAELRAVLAEVTHLIERLARGLAEAEQEATAQQAELAPQIDALIRGRAMRQAYGCASAGGRE